MEALSRTTSPSMLSDETQMSAVSWAAVAAGAVATAALTLLLLAFGAGMGFSAVSPWSDSGVSITTFKVGAGIYLIIVAVMASSIGGYLAGRLRTKWVGVHTHEVYFRDTAHGFLAWAFATVLSATILGSAATHIVSGAAQGLGVGAGQSAGQSMGGPTNLFVDKLLRPAPGAAQSSTPATAGANVGDQAVRLEISRLLTASLRDRRDLTPADQTYLARVVASRTGISQPEAEKRVSDTIVEAKEAADAARKAAAHLALWLTAAMLVGAFAASLAATEGGNSGMARGVTIERQCGKPKGGYHGSFHSSLDVGSSNSHYHPACSLLSLKFSSLLHGLDPRGARYFLKGTDNDNPPR